MFDAFFAYYHLIGAESPFAHYLVLSDALSGRAPCRLTAKG